jgi:hypothetical protein
LPPLFSGIWVLLCREGMCHNQEQPGGYNSRHEPPPCHGPSRAPAQSPSLVERRPQQHPDCDLCGFGFAMLRKEKVWSCGCTAVFIAVFRIIFSPASTNVFPRICPEGLRRLAVAIRGMLDPCWDVPGSYIARRLGQSSSFSIATSESNKSGF